jgi:hypothetical protein
LTTQDRLVSYRRAFHPKVTGEPGRIGRRLGPFRVWRGLSTPIADDHCINGTQLAKRLGIGASTLSRWVKAGKQPEPEKSIAGMLLFNRAAADRLGR